MLGGTRLGDLQQRSVLCVLGLMSGMSRDGLDMALVEIERHPSHARPQVRRLASATEAYDAALHARLMRAPEADAGEVARLDLDLAEAWANSVNRFLSSEGIEPGEVDLLGSHGQTIHHTPRSEGRSAVTLQVGHGDVLAERTGITTVSDFRVRDIAAGGEGAPLIPYADWVLFGDHAPCLAQNLGSIGNVTVVGPTLEEGFAFDTGPANALIDSLARRADDPELGGIDRDGALSASGRIDDEVLLWLWTERAPYLVAPPPKSAGFDTFGPPLGETLFQAFADRPLADLVRTAVAFTANTIRDAYERHVFTRAHGAQRVFVSGGGTRNTTLVAALREALAPLELEIEVLPDAASDAKEAIGFALLAEATARGLAGSVARATGARGPRVLGRISPGRQAP